MCVEDNKTKKLIDPFRPFVAGRSFLQPEPSSSLLANAEAERLKFCVSSKVSRLATSRPLPELFISLERSVAILKPTVREELLGRTLRKPSSKRAC